MKRTENNCIHCPTIGMPCLNPDCALTHETYYICDRCKSEICEIIYHDDSGRDLCEDCILDALIEDGTIETERI